MTRLLRWAMLGLALGASAALAQTARISISTGGTGGVYYPLGGGMANILSKYVPGLQATAEVTGGSVDNLKLLGAGKAEVGFSMVDAAWDAAHGTDKFKDGKVIRGTANNTRRLNEILDTDAGARYVGEFSLGFNPYILQPMRDILFDEKIAGSFHFTPGQAYEETDNGNRSQVHWDMVSIQRSDYGGGEIYFDGNAIRRDGDFLPNRLRSLNRSRFIKRV